MPTVLESCTSTVRIGRPIAGEERFLEDPFPSQSLQRGALPEITTVTNSEEDDETVVCDVCMTRFPRKYGIGHICPTD